MVSRCHATDQAVSRGSRDTVVTLRDMSHWDRQHDVRHETGGNMIIMSVWGRCELRVNRWYPARKCQKSSFVSAKYFGNISRINYTTRFDLEAI